MALNVLRAWQQDRRWTCERVEGASSGLCGRAKLWLSERIDCEEGGREATERVQTGSASLACPYRFALCVALTRLLIIPSRHK